MPALILASGSPRRKELLERAGLTFSIDPSGFDEASVDPHSMPPHELAQFLSLKKAEDVAHKHPGAVVLAADTFIVHEGEIMGKPHTPEEAERMLRALSGKTHSVITGYTLVNGGIHEDRALSESIESKVTFHELSDNEISKYIATGEPLDKAGAYAIQGMGAGLVKRREGSLENIIGLPLGEVLESLKGFGILPD